MLPIVIRSSEVVLLLVPNSLREAALALGAPRWRVITRVVLPTSRPGLVTGSLLGDRARDGRDGAAAVHRSDAHVADRATSNTQMNTLPVQIFTDITRPARPIVARAWGAALTLVALVLILNLIARAVSRRSSVA